MDAFKEYDETNLLNFTNFLEQSFNKGEKELHLTNFLEVFNGLAMKFPEELAVNFSTIDNSLRLFSSNNLIAIFNSKGFQLVPANPKYKNIVQIDVDLLDEITNQIFNLINIDEKTNQKHSHYLLQYISQVTGIPSYDLLPLKKTKENNFQIFKEESSKVEFKSSLRVPIDSETNKPITNEKFKELFDLVDNELNEHINKSKDAIKLSFLKVLAAMLNGYGGTIRVGVADSGEVIGLLGDWEDMSSNGKKTLAEARGRYENWVSGSLISDNLGKEVFGYIFIDYIDHDNGQTFLQVDVEPSKVPVFVKNKEVDDGDFYIRQGTSTQKLTNDYRKNYIENNFPRRARKNNTKWTSKSLRKYLMLSSEKNLQVFFKQLDEFVKENQLIENILNISEGTLEIKIPTSKGNLSLFSINSNFNMIFELKDLRKAKYFKLNKNIRDIGINMKRIFNEGIIFNDDNLVSNLYINMKLFESDEKSTLFFQYLTKVLKRFKEKENR